MSLRLITRSIWHNPGNKGKRLRKTADAVLWQLHKRIRKGPRLLNLPNGVQFKAYPDCVVSSALIYADWPEYHELQFIRRCLAPGQVVIDAGAYVGHISLLVSDIVGSGALHAFEPHPVAFQRLTENWRLNQWSTDQLHQVALGRRKGSGYMAARESPSTTNQVVTVPDRHRGSQVAVEPLDGYRHCWQKRTVGLLKLDVEGAEADVLAGAEQLLLEDRPQLIMFESLAPTLDPEIAQFLSKVNYQIFQLDGNGDPDLTQTRAQNLFAVPAEIQQSL